MSILHATNCLLSFTSLQKIPLFCFILIREEEDRLILSIYNINCRHLLEQGQALLQFYLTA